MTQSLVLCRRWPEEGKAMDWSTDRASGGELPDGTIWSSWVDDQGVLQTHIHTRMPCVPYIEEKEMDRVSGAEVPEAEVEVTQAMLIAGCDSFRRDFPHVPISECLDRAYRAMRRAELKGEKNA